MNWTGLLCVAVDSVNEQKAVTAGRLEKILHPIAGFPEAPGLEANALVSAVVSNVGSRVAEFEELRVPGQGVPVAQQWVGDYSRAVNDIRPQLEQLTEPDLGLTVLEPAGASTAVDRARRADALLRSVHPPQPDLPALLRGEPTLAAAYAAAPSCAPDGTGDALDGVVPSRALPPAADGSDLGACADGTCQVLIERQAGFSVGDVELTVSVDDGWALVVSKEPDGGTSSASFEAQPGEPVDVGPGGRLEIGRLAAARDGAVLAFRTR